MDLYLDGNDWQAGYFLSENDQRATQQAGHLADMLMDSGCTCGMFSNQCPEGLYRCTIPGCDRTVLRENGELSDLYYGRNVERSRWVEGKSWVFRKDFLLPENWRNCSGIRLHLLSAGYHGKLFLNESFLGYIESMFTPWEFDVSNYLVPGEMNHLVIAFDPAPVAEPNHHWDRPAEFSRYHYCQMSFGWDWARHLVPSGIFDHIYLHGTGDVRLRDCLFRSSGSHITLEVETGGLADQDEVPLHIALTPKNHDGGNLKLDRTIRIQDGEKQSFTFEFDLPDARFWYPNGYGEQNLYQLTLSVPGDELTKQVGFRDLKMIRNPHSPEDAYPLTFRINGEKIFARGGNWVPADMVFSDITDEVYERQIRLAKEAGFNLLRVWGGGLIEKDGFYEACDRHGILVWQEFMHACSSYEADPIYLARKRVEGEAAVRKMRNHVAMAMYCGGNEVQYYGEHPDSPLYRQYGELVHRLAPGMPYHVSSPDLSREGEHDHGPWCFMDHSFWNRHRRFLASEFGCNGMAELESIRRFIPETDPCPRGQHWKYHFTFDTGARSMKPMEEMFALQKNDRRAYSQASMFMQGEVLEYVMEHYRKEFPRSSGCFVWQYNESWPTNSFSIIDYYTMPKAAYYRLARANAPVMLFLENDSWLVRDCRFTGSLHLCSDREDLKNTTLEAVAYDLKGSELFRYSTTGDFSRGVTAVGNLSYDFPAAVPGDILILRLTVRQGNSILFDNDRLFGMPDFHQAFRLPETALTAACRLEKKSGGESLLTAEVTNTGAYAALSTRCRLADKELALVYWQDNYRVILPGETRQFRAAVQGDAPQELELYAWNHPETICSLQSASRN